MTETTFGEGPTTAARAGAIEATLARLHHHRRPLEREMLERRRFRRLTLVDKRREVHAES